MRQKSLRRFTLIATAIVVAACSDSPTAPVPSVTGRVTASATGDPVVGATIMVGTATTTTNADGRFELTGLVEGAAKIQGTATGFDPFEADITIPDGPVTQDIAMKRIQLFVLG